MDVPGVKLYRLFTFPQCIVNNTAIIENWLKKIKNKIEISLIKNKRCYNYKFLQENNYKQHCCTNSHAIVVFNGNNNTVKLLNTLLRTKTRKGIFPNIVKLVLQV